MKLTDVCYKAPETWVKREPGKWYHRNVQTSGDRVRISLSAYITGFLTALSDGSLMFIIYADAWQTANIATIKEPRIGDTIEVKRKEFDKDEKQWLEIVDIYGISMVKTNKHTSKQSKNYILTLRKRTHDSTKQPNEAR